MRDNGKEDARRMRDNVKEDARKGGGGADKRGGDAFTIPILSMWKNRGGADKRWGALTVLYGKCIYTRNTTNEPTIALASLGKT